MSNHKTCISCYLQDYYYIMQNNVNIKIDDYLCHECFYKNRKSHLDCRGIEKKVTCPFGASWNDILLNFYCNNCVNYILEKDEF
jgi:hypothetical protein